VHEGLNVEAIESATDAVLRALARDEPSTARPLLLLLRRYTATGRDDIRDALEPALARALDCWRDAAAVDVANWSSLFVEAARASHDDRLLAAADEAATVLRRTWGREADAELLAAGIEACIASESFVQEAIDELERLVAAAYRPGEGVADGVGRAAAPRGRLASQVATASALLTAYTRTGRLPYSMLAEELMQYARRTLWDDELGGFRDRTGDKPFTLNCDAARVLCRLAALHGRDDYQRAAVVAPDADYVHDAARTLESLLRARPTTPIESAAFGVALGEWLDTTQL
jgi:hypothetical protein